MSIDFFIVLLIIVLAVAAVAYALGWDQSVKKWRKSDHKRSIYIQDLDNQISYFNQQMDDDPQRAWVDVGIIHALNTVESASEELRSEVTKRRERTP